MKETENKKPDYYGDEDSPIIGVCNQDSLPHYNVPKLYKYIVEEEAKGRTNDEITLEEIEQFRVK